MGALGLLGDFLGGGVGGVLDEAMNSVIGLFVGSLGGAVEGLVSGFFDQAARPQVTAAFFIGDGGAYQTVASVSCLLLAGTTTLGVMIGILAGEPGRAVARIARDILLAVLAIIGFPWVVEQMLVITDVISEMMIPDQEIIKRLIDALAAPPEHDIAGMFVAALTFMTTVLVFLELLVRNALALIVTALAPLSFAAMTMRPARSAAGQVVKISVAVAFSKPAIFIALRVGTDFLDADKAMVTPSSWGRYLTAVAIIMISAFMPFVVWRLIPFAETFVLAQGLSRAPFRAAMQGVQSAYWLQALGQGRGAAARSGGAGQGGQSPQDPGQHPPGGSLREPRSLPDPPPARRRRRRTTPENPPTETPSAGTGTHPTPDPGPDTAANGGQRPTPHDPPYPRQPPPADGTPPGLPPGWRRRRPTSEGGPATPPSEESRS
ncbi:hypothetical protein [Parafrankia sp. EUN1f]|uniref:hypothetical protein n=1 Tax=Parafrankia sp. EUN1f TaxID=102897 RepID=UPI0001C474A1|nr:hypothetical protein [Parafrankia sp. EUN1f]EFC79901.1 hypothetical protein FrEUN1fDRAFT_6993 [Parafrankia sp. EUN1f]